MERFRLAEVLAAMSLVTDLTRGHPEEEALRACLIATRLAAEMGVEGAELSDVFYATLLRFLGCTATSHEYAAHIGGDDIAVRRRADMTDFADPRQTLAFLLSLGTGSRLRRAVTILPGAKAVAEEGTRAHCDVAVMLAERVGLPDGVQRALREMFERWDGKGGPRKLRGEDIAPASRFASVAFAVAMFEPMAASVSIVRKWSRGMLDPSICETFLARSESLLDEIRSVDPWTTALEAEPGTPRLVRDDELDRIIGVFADMVELKSPFFHGYSTNVGALAERAAPAVGVEPIVARRAGMLHDIGRVAVSTGTWEKAGSLTTGEQEQVRLHPYHSERILLRAPALGRYAEAAGAHHERLDGTGYHRGTKGAALGPEARLIAVADTYQAMISARPHRWAFSPAEAARMLEDVAAAGRLDHDAVVAVVSAAGETPPRRRRREGPAGLTTREIEIVHLLGRGVTEKAVALALRISKSTVHTHVQHIYAKTGLTSRAGLALFAMEHGILGDREII
jgi:HD-GYP domain-containing protein (c-di-GMP phosphodiesterase class II)